MGEVYAATEVADGRRVALKLLHTTLTAADRSRFLREGQLAASIDHPNSVYVFGSEEVDGMPFIVMELLAGGTLKDRVEREGPLGTVEAVDAILQVISGLDAALHGGILHRDVKPSNCFVDLDGTVKIGDFGLSISTLGRGMDTLSEGRIQGTPQFAAPEQLRGEPLDVRADIYAVGGTLHYLLTGHAPFDAPNLAAIISCVLTTPSPRASSLQRSVPRDLDAIIAGCLSKRPEGRPTQYRELYEALRPFSSQLPAPAPLPVRTAAGAVDLLLLLPLTGALALGSYRSSFAEQALGFCGMLLYFAAPEGRFGKTAGKWLCGIQVISSDEGRRPGLSRSLSRALLFTFVWHLSPATIFAADTVGHGALAAALRFAGLFVTYAVLGALFRTARRRNGYTALHDAITSTRVALLPATAAFELPAADIPLQPATESGRVGPYRIIGTVGAVDGGRLLSASDDVLNRKVWIYLSEPGTPPVTPERRTLARPARLRWLAGDRMPGQSWDAYEAPTGAPLDALPLEARSWRLVRGWLVELATEIERSLRDGVLPRLAVDRVWIASRGHVRLIDFVTDEVDPADAHAGRAVQRFLAEVARGALPAQIEYGARYHLPQSAQQVLAQLDCAGFETVHTARVALEALLARPDRVSLRRRAASMLLPGLPLLIQAIAVAVALGMMRRTAYGPILLAQLTLFGMVSVASAGISPGGVVLRLWEIAVADYAGSAVSRVRAMGRNALAWSPLFVATAVLIVTDLGPAYDNFLSLTAVICWLAGAAYALVNPERGLQDRLSGTWLIAR